MSQLPLLLLFAAAPHRTLGAGDFLPPRRVHYSIDLELAPGEDRLLGRERIRLVNRRGRPLERVLLVGADGEAAPEISLGGARLAAVPVPEGAARGPGWSLELPAPVPPGGELHLDVAFELALGEAAPPEVRRTGWHPRLWWGRATHDDFDVGVDAPGYGVALAGRLDPDTGRYVARDVRELGLFLTRVHEIDEREAGDVLVRAFFRPAGAECAELLLDTAADAVAYYRERFGSYPQPTLTILPGAPAPVGGYPFATGIVVIHGQERMQDAPELHWRWITAHEVGHQYWGEHVLSPDPGGVGWLTIGLGVLADRGYCASRGLELEMQRRMMGRYVQGARQGLDTTIARRADEIGAVDFDFNNVVVHGKGYSVVSALASWLGPEVVQRVERRALAEFAGRALEAHAFQALCEAESEQELDWFFEPWVSSNRVASYEVTSVESRPRGDAFVTEVVVTRRGDLSMPVPVEVVFEDGTRECRWTDRLVDPCVLSFEGHSPAREARLDPDAVIGLVPPAADGAESGG